MSDHRAALEQAVTKMMNSRFRPDSYADLFETAMTTENRLRVLKDRFGWSRYQMEEVLRLKRSLLADVPNHEW